MTTLVPAAVSLSVRDHCLCLHVHRAARALARRFDRAFAPLGLTNGQFSLMMVLSRRESKSIGQVAASLAMDRTTVTAMLKPLERRGLVRTTVDKRDRRGRLVSLTAEGRTLLARAFPLWKRTHAELDRHLARQDGTQLRHVLRALS